MQCEGYKTHCEKCGHHYLGSHAGYAATCPECGTERARCGRKAVAGYRLCDKHGGPNPKHNFYGLGGRVISSGKSPGAFPLTKLAGKYLEMQKDGRLLSNRASIDVVRNRIRQLAERIDLNEAPDRLSNIKKLWEDYKQQRATEIELDAEFERAYHDYASWKQMFEAIDIDRKLVESEVKVIKEIHAVLTAEDAYELTAQLLASIISTTNSMEGVDDHVKLNFLKRIQYEFTRIVGDRLGARPGGGSGETGDAEGGELD